MVNPAKVINGLLGAEEDLADFIQNGPSEGFPGHVRDKFRHRCNEFANLPPWAQGLSGVAGGSIKRFCEPYWNDNGWDGPRDGRPFPGGQCAVQYQVGTLGTTACPTRQTGFGPSTAGPGPISGVTSETIDTGQFPAPLRTTWTVQFADTARSFSVRHDIGVTPCIRAFTADPGTPDDCGDLPIDPEVGPNPPPDPGPLPGPEPTNNPDPENPIPFLPIPPFNDPVFGPQPVTGPSDSPAGGDPAPPAGGDGLPGSPDAIGDQVGEVTGGDEGEDVDFGDPPEGSVWVGCIVELEVDNRIPNIPGTGPQSTVWPSVRGNVALKFGSFYGRSEKINSKYFDLTRPNTSLTLTGCFLQVQPGGIGKVFPISAVTCPDNPCGEQNG